MAPNSQYPDKKNTLKIVISGSVPKTPVFYLKS